MSGAIEITPEQGRALAGLAATEGRLALHQVAEAPDVYATPHGSAHGFRIAVDGHVSPIGETLPARD